MQEDKECTESSGRTALQRLVQLGAFKGVGRLHTLFMFLFQLHLVELEEKHEQYIKLKSVKSDINGLYFYNIIKKLVILNPLLPLIRKF